MAKRQCDPTSGSIGLQTYLVGKNGQLVRIRKAPKNPKSAAQIAQRNILADCARAWRILTDAQRAAWAAAAEGVKSKPRLAQYGMLSGEQLFCKINATLATCGQDRVDSPPAFPAFEPTEYTGLTITSTGGVIAVKLNMMSDMPEGTMVRVSKAVSAGIGRTPRLAYVGTPPATAQGFADITALYTGKYGVLVAGRRIFVGVNQQVSGWIDDPVVYDAVVPVPA